MKHTPGPWKNKGYGFRHSNAGYAIVPEGKPTLAIVDNDNDANLIAAAPAMYKALEKLQEMVNSAHSHECAGWECAECNPNIMNGIIYDALAQAEGKE